MVYHYWNDGVSEVWEDMKNPILVSIAILRGHDAEIPIYVIDASEKPKFWSVFPDLLNFRVIAQKPKIPLRNTADLQLYSGISGVKNFKLLSRPFDIEAISWKIREDVLVHLESDIYWLQPPLPLQRNPVEHFHFNFYNSGFWYYNKRSPVSQEFFQWWKHHILLAVCNQEHRELVVRDYPWRHFQDEAVLHYCAIKYKVNYSIADNLNLIYKKELPFEENFGFAKNLHFIGQEFPANRGLIGLFIDRFWAPISKSLEPRDLAQIFGTDYSKYAGKYTMDDLKYINFALYRRYRENGVQEIGEVKKFM